MALYVFTLGFHADHIIRRLSRARDVKGVLVVTGKPATRSVYNAFQEVVAFCEKADYPLPDLVEVPVDDGGSAVSLVVERLRGWDHIVADVGGGLRGVVAATIIALLIATKWASVELYVYGEREDSPEMFIPLNAVSAILFGIPHERKRILEVLSQGEADIATLAKLLNKSEKTVKTYVSDLRRAGFVSGGETVKLTPWGFLAINIG